MLIAVWAPLLLPLLAAPLARRLADALSPRAAAWTLAGSAAVLAGGTLCSLGLLAAAGLLQLPPIAALGHLSLPWLTAAAPSAPVAAAVAALALAALTALAVRTARRHHHDLRTARATLPADDTDPHQLTVLEDERADAFALPGRLHRGEAGRVVVTTGMLRALSGPERAALLAHERAHLTGRHHLFLALAEHAADIHPALRQLRTPLGYHLERWADEVAAVRVGDRTVTARAVGRAALAANRTPRPARPKLAAAAHSGPVPRRVAALLQPRPAPTGTRLRPVAVALAACLALSTAASLEATADLHHTVEAAQQSAGEPED
ncbi:M56 family metallopeptidase [Streptomyces sp. SP17BM10]|uniref:M56 family metallopeptidase n=1 Tax=Streptomyces sp. SP17BM10 TaxID=3002530 RepID=UPI002E795FB6|nr:M56 family metallopeptidase [Streptomyces sp. SP17BM10]MEE1785248.1 M56 family metallopeptidase [Streptomyces sp. SP17BM10]